MTSPFASLNQELKLQQKEFKLQCAVVEQLPYWYPGLRFFHIPNRGGSATDGYFKKMMGAKKGASDLVFTWRALVPAGPKGTISYDTLECGLIELKAPGGKLSNDQNKFLSSYAAIGWRTAVATSCRDVFETLFSWGLQPGSKAVMEPDYRTAGEKKQAAYDFFAP